MLYKGQTMPEKNRFPAVLQPVAFDVKNGLAPHGNPRVSEQAFPLKASDYKDPQLIAYSVALRGRDGGATAELGDDLAGCLRASGGGGDKPHVLAPAVCVTGEITHTLKGDGFDGSEDGTGRGQPIVVHGTQDPDIRFDGAHTLGRNSGQENALLHVGMAVRRLMPIECHRLQGFPDFWCAVPTGPKGDKIAADGPQYKQLGNSWAVNHARWVGCRIQGWLDRQIEETATFDLDAITAPLLLAIVLD